MCRRILFVGLLLVMCVAIYLSNIFGHMRGVEDADKRIMRNISRAVLVYHRELDTFLNPSAREQTRLLEEKFGVASKVSIREIEHPGAKGFVRADVTRKGVLHDETIHVWKWNRLVREFSVRSRPPMK